jgi:site-specific DNA-cytosine methylase
VPQRRQRIYILAFRKDMNIKNFSFPKPELWKFMLKIFSKMTKIHQSTKFIETIL